MSDSDITKSNTITETHYKYVLNWLILLKDKNIKDNLELKKMNM